MRPPERSIWLYFMFKWLYAIMVQFDLLVFKASEYFFQTAVKKSKFKKHKYRIEKEIMIVEYIFTVACVLAQVAISILEKELILGIIILGIWLPLLAFKLFNFKLQNQVIEHYDFLWNLRKSPEVYNMVKAGCIESFKEYQKRRIQGLALYLGILLASLMMIMAVFSFTIFAVMFMCFTSIFTLPIISIFDYDEPDERKKVKEPLTEIMRREIERLIGQFAPRPVF